VLRAVVIGVDTYRTQGALQGAVADARDLAGVLRRSGAAQIEMLTEADATRAAIAASLEGVLSRTGPGDLVAVSFSGLGAFMAGGRGAAADGGGAAPALLLHEFDPSDEFRRTERLWLGELSEILGRIAARGARSLLVLDTCFGSGGARQADPRTAQAAYRCVDKSRLGAAAPPDGVAEPDGPLVPSPPAQSLVLTAAESSARVLEVWVPGWSGRRGALSFAVARGLEGRADFDGDGVISPNELSSYVGQVAYQLADNRQRAEGILGEPRASASSRTRGFIVVPRRKDQVQIEGEGQEGWDQAEVSSGSAAQKPAADMAPAAASPGPAAQKFATDTASAADGQKPVEVAVVGGRPPPIPPAAGRTPIRFLESGASDVVWDISAREVVARGDTVAVGVDEDDIQDVIDRLSAVESLKVLGSSNPEEVKVVPNDTRHPTDADVTIRIGTGRSLHLVVFNLAGDGTVQLLYPVKNDPRSVKTPFTLPPTVVRPPFGADCVVAVTSRAPLRSLERALQDLDGKRAPLEALKSLRNTTPRGSRIGFATLFTGS